MIAFYKNTDIGIEMINEPVNGCWINVVDPTNEEITQLEGLGVPRDYITYPLDLDERARTERENGDLLIILRVPWFQGKGADVPYISIPLGIIMNSKCLLTVCRYDHPILQEFASGRARSLSTGKRNRFVLRVMLNTANLYLNYLRTINKVVDGLEDQLQLSTRNKEVLELLKYQKSLTYFTTALKTNELMLERLQRSQLFKQYPEDEDLLEDVITENQQAIEMNNIAGNNLSSTMGAFASIISNNLNGVMKFLASITIILSLPTMIASFYGMNVVLPFQEHPSAFVFVALAAILICVSATLMFLKRDWL